MKKSLICASKGYLSQFYIDVWELPVWEIVEAIELVSEIHEQSKDVSIFEALADGD